MITVKFMNNPDPINKVKKTPTDVLSISANFKGEVSRSNPFLIVEGDISAIANVNYAYIPDFQRYYFLESASVTANGLYTVSLSCDLLMSFADSILANTAIISKQENSWNLYLNDGSFSTYQNPLIFTHEFPNGFSTYEFVLAVAGK